MDLSKIDKTGFSKNDHKILDYLIRNSDTFYSETARDIAKKIGISPSTIGRFFQKLGYKNFKNFKINILSQNARTPSAKIRHTLDKLAEESTPVVKYITKTADNLETTATLVSETMLEKAAAMITTSRKIYVFSPDASAGLAEILRYRLRRFGIEFITLTGGSSIYEYLISLSSKDLILMFSYSRLLAESEIILRERKRVGFQLIIFTDLLSIDLEKSCDAVIYSYRGEPTEYHSMAAPLIVLDYLILKTGALLPNSTAPTESLNGLRSRYQELIRR
ncbi:HTH-type transcriptional regulator MurR [Eubacterium limosum]|uniref:HTH-type transcriptional regulator MurR n=1 Tax=Eubacterium limosum TaxID=1736 RepID=A0A6N3HF17_EUBLI